MKKDHVARDNYITRRQAVQGATLGTAAIAAASVIPMDALADQTGAPAAAPAAADALYPTIAEELNAQDPNYTQYSGDLSHVLSPWKMAGLELPNRIVKSAAGTPFEWTGGWDAVVEYYRRLAAGGTAMIFVENSMHIFSPYTSSMSRNFEDIPDEEPMALAEAIHSEGGKCGWQVETMGSGWNYEVEGRGGKDAALMTPEEIQFTIDRYVAAAKKIHSWGFDAVELNCAGDNISQWFLTPFRNSRDDEYGCQDFDNRVRFIGDIIERVHAECGDGFPVQVLIDGIQENDASLGDNSKLNTLEDNIEIAKALERRGVSSLHVRLGPQGRHVAQFLNDLYFDTPGCMGQTGFGTQFDFSRHFQGKLMANHYGCGMMLTVAKEFKNALSIPVGTVTYMDPAHAPDLFDRAIADGMVDFLLMNRPINVDNEYVRKLTEGRLDEIRPCTRCGHCFTDTEKGEPYPYPDVYGGSWACRIEPIRGHVGMNGEGIPGGFDPLPGVGDKKVMVVGGGPAGMEAARIAAERGYEVALYEKNGYLGGLLPFAAAIKGPHQNLPEYVAWSQRDLELKGVAVETGIEVDAELVAERQPDVVIVATGGVRPDLSLEGDDTVNVIGIDEVLSAPLGLNVTILGGNCQAFDVAMYLLAQGKRVTLVMEDPITDIAKGQALWAKGFSVPMLYARGTRVWGSSELVAVGGGQATVKPVAGAEVTYPCDTVVDARDMLPNTALVDALDGVEAYAVGDCDDPYNIEYAVRAGNFTARRI